MHAVLRSFRTPKKRAEGRAGSFAVLGIAVCFVLWASSFIYRSSVLAFDGERYFVLFDDAMISMRYGWNLAHGLGLVWNAGEYVEGYTNPLMTLAMALASLPFDKSGAVLAVQVFGVVLMLANAYLVMRIAEHLFPQEADRSLFRALAFACGLSYYPLLFWSLLGMETGLLAVLVSLSVLSALRYVRDRRPAQAVLVSVSLGLAFLTRPDAVVFALPVFAYAFYGVYGTPKAFAPSRLAALFGPLALFVAGHQAFRWFYYGEILPNTYTLKVSGMPLAERISTGTSFTVPFLEEVWVLLVLVAAALLLDRGRGTLLLAGVFAVTLLYQVWTGGDAWNLWRIFSPAMPLMLMLAAWAILRLVRTAFETSALRGLSARSPALPGLVSVLALLAVLCFVNLRFLPEITMERQSEEEYLNEKRMSVVLALEEFTTPEASVGMYGVGTVPYYTGRPGIDFLGKMDPRIANRTPDLVRSRPGHNKYDLEYSIKELKPTHVQGFEWYGQSVLDWAQDEYVGVKYKDAHLNLLKGSDEVRWDKIDAAIDAGEASLTTPR